MHACSRRCIRLGLAILQLLVPSCSGGPLRIIGRIAVLVVLAAVVARADDWPEIRGKGRLGVWNEAGILEKFPESGLFIEEPKLSPDGRWLAYCRNNGGSSLWLLELGTTQQTAP